MKKINWIFTLTSLSVLVVTIERFSPTTKIYLEPFHFFRLHEVFQMSLIILATVLIPFWLLKIVTNNFESLKTNRGFWLGLVFITGVYFYSTGNGIHETASFYFNDTCDVKQVSGQLCHSLFFNDYYTGNVVYFIGAALMSIPTLLFSLDKEDKNFTKRDFWIAMINAVIYAFAIFAYSAFDVVLVGLIFSIVMMVIFDVAFLKIWKKYVRYPLVTYSAVTYTLGTIAAIVVRLLR